MQELAPIPGRCLCGAVTFELLPPTDFVAHCHCRSCRLSHAAAFVTWTSVPLERFRFLSGERELGWYRSSASILWGFCRHCGSSMLYRADREGHPEAPKLDRMYVAAGSLAGPLDRAPTAHVSYEERVDWNEDFHRLPRHLGKSEQTVD